MPKVLKVTMQHIETGEVHHIEIPLFIAFARCTSPAWGIVENEEWLAYAVHDRPGHRMVAMLQSLNSNEVVEVPAYLVDFALPWAMDYLWREYMGRMEDGP